MLVLDIEAGSATLRNRPDVDVKPIRSVTQMSEVYDELERDAQGGKPYYKSVGIDSLTELQKLDMLDIMRAVKKKDPDRDIEVPSMREWGKSGDHMRKIVRMYRDLPYNVFFTCLIATDKDDATGAITYHCDLPGKLKVQIPGFLDVVGYLDTNEVKGEGNETVLQRRLLVQPTKRYDAKDRLGVGGPIIEDPTIPKLFDSIHNSTKKEK